MNLDDVVEVVLCPVITKNNFYVNLLSMKGAFQQLSSILNVYCNNHLISLLNINMNYLNNEEIFLAFYGNIWHRVKLIEKISKGNSKVT